MGECKGGAGDCQIKLFGKTIPVPEAGDATENTHQDTSDQPEVVDAEDPKSSPPGDDEANLKEKLKRPDKVLPCPRCNSMDTKFCYFNNYNVSQPRHFCKNCQRYWTAGGAMRNVPVGAGRRKNKNAVAASHYLQRVRAAGDPLKTNGTVLSFGHGGPALLDLAEQVSHLKEKLLIPTGNHQSVGPCSQGSCNRDDDTKDNATAAKPANGDQHPATIWPYVAGAVTNAGPLITYQCAIRLLIRG